MIPTVTVNNFFTTINITFFVIGGAVGIIGTIITKFGNKFIDEYFKNREITREKKRELAGKVIEICVEGASVGYNAMPGSQRHIQYIATRAEKYDKTISDDLRRYLGTWVLCAVRQTPGSYENKNPSNEDIEFCADQQKQAKALEDSIIEHVRKWE